MRQKNKLKSSMSINLLTQAESLRREKEQAENLSPNSNEDVAELKKRGRPRKLEILRKKMRPGRPPKE
jgi:hypothetical protein